MAKQLAQEFPRVHGIVEDQRPIIAVYKCAACKREFDTKNRLKRHDCTAKPSQASVKHLCGIGVVVDEIMNWVAVNQTWLGNLLPDTLELDAIERKLLPDDKN